MIQGKKTLLLTSIITITLIDLIYLQHISNVFDNSSSFGEYGYPRGEASLKNIILVIFFLGVLSPLIPNKINSPSSLVLIVYYYVALLPFLSLYTLGITSTETVYYLDFFNIISFFFITKLFTSNRGKNSSAIKIYRKISVYYAFFISIVSILLVSFLYSFYVRGGSASLSNVLDVYEQRAVFHESLGTLGSLLAGLSIYGIVPLLFFVSKTLNRAIFSYIAVFVGIITFLATGSKLFLGSIFLTLILIKYYKYNASHLLIGIPLIALISASYTLSTIWEEHTLLSLFVRRMLIIPAQIFSLYHEHSFENGFNHLARYTSILTGSDGISISHVMGALHYRAGSSANSGIISDAYANFGTFGVLIYAFLFSSLFSYINKLNRKYKFLITPLFIGLSISLTNSSLLAVFVYQISMLILIFHLFSFTQKIHLNFIKKVDEDNSTGLQQPPTVHSNKIEFERHVRTTHK